MIYVVYFSQAGAPATGLSPTIDIYKKVSDGTDVTPAPTVMELGGGFYTYAATPAEARVVRLSGGGGLADADNYKVMQITPHDGDLDAQVSSRAPESGGNITAIRAKTDNLPADPAANAEILAALGGLHDITVGEILAGDLSDHLGFPANSLADLLRKLFWVVCNRIVINDANGELTAYKTDGVTPGMSGSVADNGATTERSNPTWP
jgi:hypothetical protein